MRRRMRYGFTHVPTSEAGIDRLVDRLEESVDPIDELPDAEPIDRIVRSMAAESRGRFQKGSLL